MVRGSEVTKTKVDGDILKWTNVNNFGKVKRVELMVNHDSHYFSQPTFIRQYLYFIIDIKRAKQL